MRGAGEPTEYVRLHEGFATDLGLELHANKDPESAGITPQSFRCLCYAPQGFNMVHSVPEEGMPPPPAPTFLSFQILPAL